MATYVIGDIHGRLALLDQLIGNVHGRCSRQDRLLGDLIDRGYDAPGVINRVIELTQGIPTWSYFAATMNR